MCSIYRGDGGSTHVYVSWAPWDWDLGLALGPGPWSGLEFLRRKKTSIHRIYLFGNTPQEALVVATDADPNFSQLQLQVILTD